MIHISQIPNWISDTLQKYTHLKQIKLQIHTESLQEHILKGEPIVLILTPTNQIIESQIEQFDFKNYLYTFTYLERDLYPKKPYTIIYLSLNTYFTSQKK